MKFTGRRMIFCDDVGEITRNNVVSVLENALATHNANRVEIEYLWKYYKGDQPILYREKLVRPEINNRIVENKANEIVSFKVGYIWGEPIQIVSRNNRDGAIDDIARLNDALYSIDQHSIDRAVGEWMMIAGVGYKLTLPNTNKLDLSPIESYSLDPRETFMVYRNNVKNDVAMGVTYKISDTGVATYYCYTENRMFTVRSGSVISEDAHVLRDIPIKAYPANKAMTGAFELVLPLLDALNQVTSDRVNGVEQFIQSFMKFINCDIELKDMAAFREAGAILLKSIDGTNPDVDIITSELNQQQTQVFVDNLYKSIISISGMPKMGSGDASTSDTGAAVLLRDGWSLAEARAKDIELMYKASEKKNLKLILQICKSKKGNNIDLNISDLDLKFTRRNYENIQSKAQVFSLLSEIAELHPALKYSISGLFADPENAYEMSKAYVEEHGEVLETEANNNTGNNAVLTA